MGIDETIERRRGERIAAKRVYRDPVCSSYAHFVKVSGWCWVCLMVLARIPWVERVWVLPFLTVLAPSARYYQSQGRQPCSMLDRAWPMRRLVQRWLPSGELVVVGDRTHAALEWLDAMRKSAGVITRSRLGEPTRPWKLVNVAPWYGQKAHRVHIAFATAVWWHSGLPAVLIRWLLIRDLAGTFAPQALLATKPDLDPR